jgi:hypothetical protein
MQFPWACVTLSDKAHSSWLDFLCKAFRKFSLWGNCNISLLNTDDLENFRLDLRIMKTGLANLKPWAGLFCEALMLIFIFIYAHTDVSGDAHSKMSSSTKADACMQQMTFRASITTESVYQVLPRISYASLIKNFSPIDLAGLKVSLCKALAVGHFERNYFYNQLTDNAP